MINISFLKVLLVFGNASIISTADATIVFRTLSSRDQFNYSIYAVILFCIKYVVDTNYRKDIKLRHYEFEQVCLDSRWNFLFGTNKSK